MESFREVVEHAIAANQSVVAFLNCEISYSGRAETFLERGDRIVLIKADNAVLVHQPEGNNPINYMKPGSEIAFDSNMLHVMNAQEKAWLEVKVFTVHHVAAHKLLDGRKLDLAGNEKDMSDYIRDHPGCISNDFRPVKREEQTDVGFIDVFGHDGTGRLVVVECKRVTASLSAVDQLRRYVDRVKKIKDTEVHGIIAAPGITPNAQQMLASLGFEFRRVEPPKRLERWNKNQSNLADF